jgi:hypothetical protein
MIPGHRAGFGRGGYFIIGGVLTLEQAGCCAAALDRVCDEQAAAGDVNPGGPVHVLSPVGGCRGAAGLTGHLKTFPRAWPVPGRNVHICHSHLHD